MEMAEYASLFRPAREFTPTPAIIRTRARIWRPLPRRPDAGPLARFQAFAHRPTTDKATTRPLLRPARSELRRRIFLHARIRWSFVSSLPSPQEIFMPSVRG